MSDEIDDKKVIFESATERIIHVHRGNIVANVQGEWTRPTILIAAQGQTPVFCHEVRVRGHARVVERPPGVHMVVDDGAELVALDADGGAIRLPHWARAPGASSDVAMLRNAVDLQRRIQTIMDQVAERLREAGLPADAVVLQQASRNLGKIRRALASHADRGIVETQPIEIPPLPPGSAPAQPPAEGLSSAGIWTSRKPSADDDA